MAAIIQAAQYVAMANQGKPSSVQQQQLNQVAANIIEATMKATTAGGGSNSANIVVHFKY